LALQLRWHIHRLLGQRQRSLTAGVFFCGFFPAAVAVTIHDVLHDLNTAEKLDFFTGSVIDCQPAGF
jgi:hypothetical protein